MDRDTGQKIVLANETNIFGSGEVLEIAYPDPPLRTEGIKESPLTLKELADELMKEKGLGNWLDWNMGGLRPDLSHIFGISLNWGSE